MASFRNVLAACSYISDVVIPKSTQLCVPQSRHQSCSVITNPWELHKKSRTKHHLSSYLHNRFKRSDKHNWKDTVLLITGASSGIGSVILRMSLNEGVKQVVNLDIDEKKGLALQYELNQKYGDQNKVRYINCDVADEQKLIENFQSVLSDQDNEYVVVNNSSLLGETTPQSSKDIESNMTGLITASLTALELMRADREGQGGAIINIATAAALCPLPLTPVHESTKSAVLTLSLGLGGRDFFSKTGVRVMTVCYGATDCGLGNENAKMDVETYPKISPALRAVAGPWSKSAAKAVIEIYKYGRTGSIWISKERKPAKDVTHVIRKSFSVTTEPTFIAPP